MSRKDDYGVERGTCRKGMERRGRQRGETDERKLENMEKREETKGERVQVREGNIPPDSMHEVSVDEENRSKGTGDPHMTLLTN